MGQIILFSLFAKDLTKIFPQSQRSENDWLIFLLPSPDQWNVTYQNPIPSRETTTLNGTGTPESRSMRRISVTQLLLPSLAKHLFLAIHHKRPSPRPWCASDSVHSRVWMRDGDGWDWGSKPLHIPARNGETTWYPLLLLILPTPTRTIRLFPVIPWGVSLALKDSESRYDWMSFWFRKNYRFIILWALHNGNNSLCLYSSPPPHQPTTPWSFHIIPPYHYLWASLSGTAGTFPITAHLLQGAGVVCPRSHGQDLWLNSSIRVDADVHSSFHQNRASKVTVILALSS